MSEISKGLMNVVCLPAKTKRQYDTHRRRWQGCRKCSLGETGKRKVFCRGVLPCEMLFIGEAPGPDEQKEGYTFVGRAGAILQQAIEEVICPNEAGKGITFGFAIINTVLCFPTTKPLLTGQIPTKVDFRKPSVKEVKACSPRLLELVEIAEPRAIVLLGSVAASEAVESMVARWKQTENQNCLVICTPHPAWISRRGGIGTADYYRLVLHIRAAAKVVRKSQRNQNLSRGMK